MPPEDDRGPHAADGLLPKLYGVFETDARQRLRGSVKFDGG
jgi:hypothetical protein